MSSTNDAIRAYYNQIPYSSHAYPHCAPEQLAAVASAFGHDAPPLATARILELGGAAGGNLIPAAIRNPRARLVGLDLSDVQIATANERVQRLALENITFLRADIAEVDSTTLGEFDYIICHGLYSWVPQHVQEAMLRICSENLSAQGVAFVSYNTYPGWKAKEMVRDAMLLHAKQGASPESRIAHAKGMLGFLQNVSPPGGVMGAAVRESASLIKGAGDKYLAHEYLEPYNLPCYFQDFVARARGQGLMYLAEAEPSMMVPSNYGHAVAEALSKALSHDQVIMEQYLDFAVNRAFRQTLLVKAGDGAPRALHMSRERLRPLHYSARLVCERGGAVLDGSTQRYVGQERATMDVSHGALKVAIDRLANAWPGTVSRDELILEAQSLSSHQAGIARQQIPIAIDELLEYLVMRGWARIRLEPVSIAGAISPHPILDACVKRMITALRRDEAQVVNAWHESVDLSPEEMLLAPYLDGDHGHAALAQRLAQTGSKNLSIEDVLQSFCQKGLLGKEREEPGPSASL